MKIAADGSACGENKRAICVCDEDACFDSSQLKSVLGCKNTCWMSRSLETKTNMDAGNLNHNSMLVNKRDFSHLEEVLK